MFELEENLRLLNELKNKLEQIKDSMNIENLKLELTELEKESLKEDFWNNQKNSSTVFAKIKVLQRKVNSYENLYSELSNLMEMNQLLQIEPDNDLLKELLKNSNSIISKIDNLEIETLFSGKYDANNAIITLHPGAGGTDSQDRAEMLYRMYG